VAPRQPNVILVVLEAVAMRWTGLGVHKYETTPRLAAEARHALVFDSFYAHIGRSSNSLGSILLSTYPKLDFQDLTVEYPDLGGTSLARLFQDRGYATSFVTPSDLQWAGWQEFIGARGFERVDDYRDLACEEMVSSWGVEDRCMIDGMIAALESRGDRPFFMMGWSQQTHHPYEPTPGLPMLNLVREPVRDTYDLGRYLNVLRETDAHLGRLFDAIRSAGIADDTIVVVTGDHGQAFGYPHNTYIQGRTIYEEDVHVPLMIWSPRMPRAGTRVPVIGSHVDLAPTIAQLAGLPEAADWQGRTLFDKARAPRAYFYVAEDHFRLGVREDRWKYIYDLREGSDELFDLVADPNEQHNLAPRERTRAARLRQRLAAWAEANRLQYAQALRQPGNGV
jgi:arylsulfatase A-like enzyme